MVSITTPLAPCVGSGFKIPSFFSCHAKNIGNNRIIFDNKNMHDLNLYIKKMVTAPTYSLRNRVKIKTIVTARRLFPMDVRVSVSKHQNNSHVRD